MFYPVKINIWGSFEDIYLYKDFLYLWTSENELIKIKWQEFIERFGREYYPGEFSAFKWSFAANDFIDSSYFRDISNDEELRRPIHEQVKRIKSVDLDLEQTTPYWAGWPIVFPPDVEGITDLTIYNDWLYVGGLNGVHAIYAATESKGSRDKQDALRFRRLLDTHTASLSAKYAVLNASAFEQGLFSWRTNRDVDNDRHFNHSPNYSVSNAWIGRNFVSLGEGSLEYFKNNGANSSSREQVRNEIKAIGAPIPLHAEQITGVSYKTVDNIFVEKNTLYTAERIEQGIRLVKMNQQPASPEQTHIFKGQEFGSIILPQSTILKFAVIDYRTIVVDTDQGTSVHSRPDYGDEAYELTDNINVAMRTFPESKWYTHLVCSVQEDHVQICALWDLW